MQPIWREIDLRWCGASLGFLEFINWLILNLLLDFEHSSEVSTLLSPVISPGISSRIPPKLSSQIPQGVPSEAHQKVFSGISPRDFYKLFLRIFFLDLKGMNCNHHTRSAPLLMHFLVVIPQEFLLSFFFQVLQLEVLHMIFPGFLMEFLLGIQQYIPLIFYLKFLPDFFFNSFVCSF